jgi:hypothetical protein
MLAERDDWDFRFGATEVSSFLCNHLTGQLRDPRDKTSRSSFLGPAFSVEEKLRDHRPQRDRGIIDILIGDPEFHIVFFKDAGDQRIAKNLFQWQLAVLNHRSTNKIEPLERKR